MEAGTTSKLFANLPKYKFYGCLQGQDYTGEQLDSDITIVSEFKL